MLIGITQEVPSSFGACELEYQQRQPIDVEEAAEQHRCYQQFLREAGARVIVLPADPRFPDSVFVEDPAVVLDEIAIMTRMGALSRRGEGQAIAEALAQFRKVTRITEPATVEGGDVMRVGKTLFVGHSRRTNNQGIEQIAAIAMPFGYRVVAVQVAQCLHLKSACSPLDDSTILANRAWLPENPFAGFQMIEVPPEEPAAANVLRIGDTVLNAASFPRTAEMLHRLGFNVRTIDISELQKAESALTCSSLVFSEA